MKIVNKPPTPWSGTLATLQSYEESIGEQEHAAMKARWFFGRELLRHRVEKKNRQVGLPKDLRDLTMAHCHVTADELNKRLKFAEKYPTKKELNDAVIQFPSWRQMTRDGLVEMKRKKTKPTPRRVLRKLTKQVEDAFAHHPDLTRDEVKDIETLAALLQRLLEQIDRNDLVKVS